MKSGGKFQLALAYKNSGNFLHAESVCREILLTQPNHFQAWHLLGVLSYQCGDNDDAMECFNKALQLNTDVAETYNSLGLVLGEMGKPDEAEACHRKAIELQPDSYDGAINILDAWAIKHGTDKSSKCHNFTQRYFQYFLPIREKHLKILEIGIAQGSSLRMWKEFFQNAEIFAIDQNHNCKILDIDRVKIYIGDQSNKDFLEAFANEAGSAFDIIIDDGGHVMSQQITSFHVLFPHVRPGGIYIIEDLHTSYNSEYNGGLRKPSTAIEFLKNLVDDLNFKGRSGIGNSEIVMQSLGEENVSYFEKYIDSIHFYQSICFIFKNHRS